jgi:hypothetical protein
MGTSSSLPLVLTNQRSYKIKIYGFQATGAGFSVIAPALPLTLSAGQSITVQTTFAPQAAGSAAGNVLVSGPNLNIPLSGTGMAAVGQLSVTPSSVNFGNVNVGATGTQTITMSATGASVTVSADNSSSSQFALQGVSLPVTIPAGQSSSFSVAFKPTTSGAASGSLSFTSNASDSSLSVVLSGSGTTAVGQLGITPSTVNFGDVNVGSTGTQAITMSATGASVTVSSDASSSSQFAVQGVSLPLTIPAGQSSSFNVAFTPTGTGTASGSLTFNSNASSSTTLESVSGIGTAPQYSVNLSWNASTNVAGYNIYRSTTATGTFAKINSTPDANTAYTDSAVVAGQTYYYEATAVTAGGEESVRSTPPVPASIP